MIDLSVETLDKEIKRRRRSSRCRDAAASAMPMKNLNTGDNWVNEISEEEDKEVLFWVLVTLLYRRTSPHDSTSARPHRFLLTVSGKYV